MPSKRNKKALSKVGKALVKGARKLVGKVRKGKAKMKAPATKMKTGKVEDNAYRPRKPVDIDPNDPKNQALLRKALRDMGHRPKTGGQRMKEQKESGLRKTRKKPSGRAKKTEAHVDNVRGATVRRARAPAHFPIDQEDVRIRRLRHQNSTHEKARQEKPHVTIASGKHRVRNPMATFHNEFDPAILAGPTGGRVHRKGRSRFGKNSMASAANELNPAIRGGGGSDVARGPYGKISGLA